MRRWGLEAATFVIAIAVGVVVLWATGVRPSELFEFDETTEDTPLDPLPGAPVEQAATTTTAFATIDVASTPPTTVSPYLEATMLCVRHTTTFAFLGNVDAVNLWRFVGESEAALAAACEQIAREDSRAIDRWRWELATLPTAPATTTTVATVP